MTGVLRNRRNVGTDVQTQRMSCEGEGREGVTTRQVTKKVARRPPAAGQSASSSGGPGLQMPPPGLGDDTFPLFKPLW